jgi:hypothetical protein
MGILKMIIRKLYYNKSATYMTVTKNAMIN